MKKQKRSKTEKDRNWCYTVKKNAVENFHRQ
jgi:hypothetical protein